MTVESTTQALCDLALRFGEGDEESMVSLSQLSQRYLYDFSKNPESICLFMLL